MEKCSDPQGLFVPRRRGPQCVPPQDPALLPLCIGSLAIPCSHGWSRVRGICPREEQSECEGAPQKALTPTGVSQPGWGSAFPSLSPHPHWLLLQARSVAAAPRAMPATAAFFVVCSHTSLRPLALTVRKTWAWRRPRVCPSQPQHPRGFPLA